MTAVIMETISASAMAWLCRAAEFGLFGKKLVVWSGFRVDVDVDVDVEAALGGVLELAGAVGLGLVLALNACF